MSGDWSDSQKTVRWLGGAAAVWCLILATIPLGALWPYTLSRFALSGVSILIAGITIQHAPKYTPIAGVAALLYNPIFPFHFGKDGWPIVNWVTSGGFTLLAFSLDLHRYGLKRFTKNLSSVLKCVFGVGIYIAAAAALVFIPRMLTPPEGGKHVPPPEAVKNKIGIAPPDIELPEHLLNFPTLDLQELEAESTIHDEIPH